MGAIAHNVRELKRLLRPGTALMAVVKADGYGHGAAPVAQAALAAGAEWLGVATVEEGIQLRQAGIAAPILVLGPIAPEQAAQAVGHHLRVACFDLEVPRALAAAARTAGRTARVHLKVDTGMGRLGVRPEEVAALARAVADLPGVEVEGIFTHFASADEPDPAPTREQIARFEAALEAVAAAGVRPRVRHACNSAGLMRFPEAHYDLVRAGIALYGLPPDPGLPWPAQLRPALSLYSRVAMVKTMRPGETLSYGRTWQARGGERVATVPVGYADGYRRLFSNRFYALIGGRRCPVVGRVCMDQTLFLLPPDLEVHPGDEVVLLGRQGEEAITADDWARALGTISYEVLCLIGPRVTRVYVGGV
ncbi:MAG: alanine racemase [Bacillota bacterium]